MTKQEAAATLLKLLKILEDDIDRDAPLMQLLAYAHVAASGEVGIDQGKLGTLMKTSSAAISRTVQALSEVSYQKDREGYRMIRREFDPVDYRKRTLTLSDKGQGTLAKIQSVLR